MFRFTRNLFSTDKNPASKQKLKTSFRPGLEVMESRYALSTASGAMHTVAPPPGHLSQEIAFCIDAHTHLLMENGVALNGGTGTPAGVTSLSAGRGLQGAPDVFVKAGDGSFWKFDQNQWTRLLRPTADAVLSFATVNGGRAYAILRNVNTGGVSLQEYDGATWHKLPAIGTPRTVDAITDGSATDALFVLNTDNSMYDYFQFAPGSGFLSDKLINASAHPFSRVTEFSAGLDLQGNADVYATFTSQVGTSALYKNRLGSNPNSWAFVTNGTNYTHISATDSGAVWLSGRDHSVFLIDAFGHKANETVLGNAFAANISAATSQDVFIVGTNGSLTQWVDTFAWHTVQFGSAGTVQIG